MPPLLKKESTTDAAQRDFLKVWSHTQIRLWSVSHTDGRSVGDLTASHSLCSVDIILRTLRPSGWSHLQLSFIAWVYGKWWGSRRRSRGRAFCLQAERLLSNRRRRGFMNRSMIVVTTTAWQPDKKGMRTAAWGDGWGGEPVISRIYSPQRTWGNKSWIWWTWKSKLWT